MCFWYKCLFAVNICTKKLVSQSNNKNSKQSCAHTLFINSYNLTLCSLQWISLKLVLFLAWELSMQKYLSLWLNLLTKYLQLQIVIFVHTVPALCIFLIQIGKYLHLLWWWLYFSYFISFLLSFVGLFLSWNSIPVSLLFSTMSCTGCDNSAVSPPPLQLSVLVVVLMLNLSFSCDHLHQSTGALPRYS